MSLFEIISSILNALLGTGMLALITFRQRAAKAKTDVNKDNVELVNLTVNSMIQNVNRLLDQNRELRTFLDTKIQENEELIKRINILEKKVSSMIRTNRDVITALEKLNIDKSVVNQLKEQSE